MMDAQALNPALDGSLTQSYPGALDPTLVMALTFLIATTVIVFALLRAWQDWLALKNRELDTASSPASDASQNPQLSAGAARIELADMKERIKKLEAIASGVEL